MSQRGNLSALWKQKKTPGPPPPANPPTVNQRGFFLTAFAKRPVSFQRPLILGVGGISGSCSRTLRLGSRSSTRPRGRAETSSRGLFVRLRRRSGLVRSAAQTNTMSDAFLQRCSRENNEVRRGQREPNTGYCVVHNLRRFCSSSSQRKREVTV